MSSLQQGPARRRESTTLSSLVYAALVGAAANALHGALGQEGTRVPRMAARPASRADDAPHGWWGILKKTYAEVNKDRVLAVAGGVTFYGLLSLFPAVTVLVSLYGLVADPASMSGQLQSLGTLLPQGALSIIGDQVTRIAQSDQSKLSLAAVAGLLVALWSANAAMKAMMDALNIAYDTDEKRGFVKLNLVSLGFTLAAILAIIVMLAVIAVVPAVLQLMDLGTLGDVLLWAGRWPVIFVLMLLGLAVLYRYGPSRPDVAWRWVTPGSLFATIGLVIFSMLFSWYAANFANYNETYGSLGAVIGFLTWMWLSSTIVLVGAELNSTIESAERPGGKSGESQPDKT